MLNNSNNHKEQGANTAPFKLPLNSLPSGTDSPPGQPLAPVGGFAQESESAIEADASTVDEDSDATALHSSSNTPAYIQSIEQRKPYRNRDHPDRFDRAILAVDSDASSSPTFEKNYFTGPQSHTTVDARKPVPTDIPTPSSGYQADTEIPETEESHGTGSSQQHYSRSDHSH